MGHRKAPGRWLQGVTTTSRPCPITITTTSAPSHHTYAPRPQSLKTWSRLCTNVSGTVLMCHEPQHISLLLHTGFLESIVATQCLEFAGPKRVVFAASRDNYSTAALCLCHPNRRDRCPRTVVGCFLRIMALLASLWWPHRAC